MTMSSGLSGAATGAAVGSVGGPWGAAIGGGIGLGAGLLMGSDAGSTYHDQKQLAKLNAKLQAEQNARNQAWAEHILDISHPQMSGQDLGALLFQQGQGEATRQHDINLATTLRQNLRSGAPLSTTDIMGGFDRQNAGQWQDKMADAKLKGILGVLPGASALNIAGSVGKGEAPQMSGISETAANMSNFAGANTLGSIAQSLPAILGAFGYKAKDGQTQSPTPTYSAATKG
jgi:hypothetical protein